MQECKIPQNITAEQNVLSAMLIGAKVIDKVAEILKPEDFYRPPTGLFIRLCWRCTPKSSR